MNVLCGKTTGRKQSPEEQQYISKLQKTVILQNLATMPAILPVVTPMKKHGMLFAGTGRTTNHLKVAKKCYFTDFGNFASDTAGGNIHKKARLALWLIWPVPAHKFRRFSKKSLTATSPPVNSRKNPFSVVNYSFLPVVSFLLVLNINLRS